MACVLFFLKKSSVALASMILMCFDWFPGCCYAVFWVILAHCYAMKLILII